MSLYVRGYGIGQDEEVALVVGDGGEYQPAQQEQNSAAWPENVFQFR